MTFSWIYSDFSEDINWIRDKVKEEIAAFPRSIKYLAEYYVKKRLFVLSDISRTINFDPYIGRPVPYTVFWFAEAFGLDRTVARKLALGLVYSSIAITVRDDIVDKEISSELNHFALEKTYFKKYLSVFNELFNQDSKFWFYLAGWDKELTNYEVWNRTFDINCCSDPFSESFLKESSRYFSAVVMPTLVGLALITDNECEIPKLEMFVKHFSMGWRIYDDLKDWQTDLKVKDLNHSSTLIYARNSMDRNLQLDEEVVSKMFLSTDFIKKSYGAMVNFFKLAKKDVSDLNCCYVSRFLDEQIIFHSRRRDIILESYADFYNRLHEILIKNNRKPAPKY
jgi:hypothetical protein